jgi:hypothetical protein
MHLMNKTMRTATLLLALGAAVTVSAGSARDTGASGPSRPRLTGAALLTLLSTRTLDGSNNNLKHPDWGQTGRPYARVAAPGYGDGAGAEVAGPNTRYISNRIFNDDAQNVFSERGVTQWAFTWGQLLDHTFGLAAGGGADAPIAFNASDPLEEFENDFGAISFQRDAAAPGTGTTAKPRQQINTVSSYIDAFAVYGGTTGRLEWLRQGPVDGNIANNSALMLTTPDGYLPQVGARGNAATAPAMNLMGPLMAFPQNAIVAGDVRANENIGLTAVQTLLVREHNRIVGLLPGYLPEQLKFEIARRVVGAEEEYITYNEFLPALGVRLAPYRGYDPKVNASISNEFATVGYRAHSMIHGEIEVDVDAAQFTQAQLDAFETQGIEIEPNGDELTLVIPLNIALGNPSLVPAIGLGPILTALGAESEYKNDEMIDNQLRSVLFQVPKPGVPDPSVCLDGPSLPDCYNGVVDLAAIDIERGRDHGIPSYNDLRAAYGLPRKTSFAAITGEATDAFPADPEIDAGDPIDDPDILDFASLKDGNGNEVTPGTDAAENTVTSATRRAPLAARLKAIYGDVNNVDAFVGMASEPHVPGTEFGELQLAMWKKQFTALRDGDRFFYGNDPALAVIDRFLGISYRHTLAELIEMNTDAAPGDLAGNVFKLPAAHASISGTPHAGALPTVRLPKSDAAFGDVPAAIVDTRPWAPLKPFTA